jgi:hypothetical protein
VSKSPREYERGTVIAAGRQVRLVELEWDDGIENPVAPESWDAYDVQTDEPLNNVSWDYRPNADQLADALFDAGLIDCEYPNCHAKAAGMNAGRWFCEPHNTEYQQPRQETP